MLGGIGIPELIIILILALLLFGARRLPEIGKALGKGIREFKNAASSIQNGLEEDNEDKKNSE
jgi:sec-independent protein translocase protein TatA